MSGGRRRSVRALTSPSAVVYEAQEALAHLDTVLRAGELTGPGEAYHVVGSCAEMAPSLQRCFREISRWLEEEDRHERLGVRDGPFADDLEAAVAVATQALSAASTACGVLFDALERFQMSTSALVPSDTPGASASGAPDRRR